jgi:eukaryotic-like serine/threonine-protein kinase
MPLLAGDRIGPYEIVGLLGTGGMGEVYRARDTRLDRSVALKLLPAELASDADRLRRFELEARAASALNHPAIVAIYDLGQASDQPYISMELVEGQTMRQILQAGSMPPRRALQVADRGRSCEGPRSGDRAPRLGSSSRRLPLAAWAWARSMTSRLTAVS